MRNTKKNRTLVERQRKRKARRTTNIATTKTADANRAAKKASKE